MPTPGADAASILSHGTISSTAGRPIFPKGPAFTLENFSSRDFIVKDFVESLSDSATPANRRSGGAATQDKAFDPKPFIRTFEYALSRLSTLSEELENHENELSAAVRRVEAQHNETIDSHNRRFDLVLGQLHRLDSSLNGTASDGIDGDTGGNVAVRIGERLEELDRQRQRALDAKFLIQCWLEVSESGHLATLEDVRRLGGGDGKVRCAHIARQLLRICQRLDPDISAQVNGFHSRNVSMNGVDGVDAKNGNGRNKREIREVIERFLESLEKDLLKQFDDFYRRQNFDGMREYAAALYDFNEGSSAIGMFVNQHQFFIDRSQLVTEEVTGDGEIWERMADPDTEPPGVEPSLQSLIDEVKIVIEEESFIINRAFPYAEEVLVRFLQRVFQQSIQQRLEMVLEKAASISTLAFLRSLQSARSCIGTLVEDLKAHGLTEHPEPATARFAATLDQQLDDLFVPYLTGSWYIDSEKRNLEELYSSLLFKFAIYQSRRRKTPTTYIGSLGQRGKGLLASAREAYIDRMDSSELPASQKARLLRIAGLKDSDSASSKGDDIEVTDEEGTLSLPNAKRMLRWLAEGVGRSLELSGETPKDVSALLNLLLSHLGEIYLETGLDAANDVAASQEATKSEPDFSYIPELRTSISILHLLQTCINTVLLPLAASNITISRQMERAADTAISRAEDKISAIMQRTIDAALSWLSRLLAAQKKTDFRPREDDPSSIRASEAQLQTPTCLSVTTFLTRLHELGARAFDGRNLELFCTELALGLRSLLFEHFKRFQVNLAGGLVVSKDIAKYVELLRRMPVEGSFAGSVEALTEIGNVFVIGPEALRERLRGSVGVGAGVGGRGGGGGAGAGAVGWDRADLRPYVMRREDVGSAAVQAVLNSW